MSRSALFNREVIIKTAFFILKRKGIDHFKIRNIAKILNASTSPLYHHFKGLGEIEDAMVEDIMKLFLETTTHLEDYYTYENLMTAYCLFARRHRKLFESIFLKSNRKSENPIREKIFIELKEILKKDSNFDFEKDYHKLLSGDGLALKIFNSGKNLSEETIRKIVEQYFLAQKNFFMKNSFDIDMDIFQDINFFS